MTNEGTIPFVVMNNGRKMPGLGLGTFLGWDATNNVPFRSKDHELARLIECAIDKGYRHFDTAAVYETEEEVGLGINNKIKDGSVTREDIFVTTKLWNDHHSKDSVLPALKESLARLNLDYVDLYLMHWPMAYSAEQDPLDIDILETWQGMEEVYKLGLAKSIGMSNFNGSQVDRILDGCSVKPAVLQIEVHPMLTNETLVRHALGRGLTVMAHSPFGVNIARTIIGEKPQGSDALEEIGKRYKKTAHQVALRYLVQRGLVPIPKTINPDRLQQNMAIFDFCLTQDEVEQVSSMNRNVRVCNPSFWQGHKEYPFEIADKPIENPFA